MTTLKKLAKSKEHREAFVASQVEIGIPFQIRALRKQRDMGQQELATATGMKQPRISAIETPGYTGYTIETLSRIAAAFDVALIVRFGAFSELVKLSNEFSPDDFEVPSFDDDIGVAATQDTQVTTNMFSVIKGAYTTAHMYRNVEVAQENDAEPVKKEQRSAPRDNSLLAQLASRRNNNVRTYKTNT